ncbi:unnamed protein product, partial [Staurois parvus]
MYRDLTQRSRTTIGAALSQEARTGNQCGVMFRNVNLLQLHFRPAVYLHGSDGKRL